MFWLANCGFQCFGGQLLLLQPAADWRGTSHGTAFFALVAILWWSNRKVQPSTSILQWHVADVRTLGVLRVDFSVALTILRHLVSILRLRLPVCLDPFSPVSCALARSSQCLLAFPPGQEVRPPYLAHFPIISVWNLSFTALVCAFQSWKV